MYVFHLCKTITRKMSLIFLFMAAAAVAGLSCLAMCSGECVVNLVKERTPTFNRQILNTRNAQIKEMWPKIVETKLKEENNKYVEIWNRGKWDVSRENKKELQSFFMELRFVFHGCAIAETANKTDYIWSVSW